MKKRKKQIGLNAVFCRRLLMLTGKNDMPSAGTLGAAMYRLTQSGRPKDYPKITALALIQYLTKPEYRHNLSPRILAILDSLEGTRAHKTSASTLLSPKIFKQMGLLRDLGLIRYMPSRGCEGLTPLGRRLFKNWPYLRAEATTKEYAFKRAAAAERTAEYYMKQARATEQRIRELEHAKWNLSGQLRVLQNELKEKNKPAPSALIGTT